MRFRCRTLAKGDALDRNVSTIKLFAYVMVLLLAGFLLHRFLYQKKNTYTEMNSIALPAGWKADTVKVDKSDRMLALSRKGKTRRSYSIFLGENPTGHKRFEGDERTPEGLYTLDWRMAKGSCCHKSIHISYPNKRDIAQAKKDKRNPGGSVMIHGMLNGWNTVGLDPGYDWTNGCIGMFNNDIDEVWKYVDNGTVIVISP